MTNLVSNGYTLSSIHNILDANIKLLDKNSELERINSELNYKLLQIKDIINVKDIEINNLKSCINFIIEGKDNEENEDIFSII